MSCVLETLTEAELIQRKKYLLHQLDKIDKQLDIIKNELNDQKEKESTELIDSKNKIIKNIKIKINIKKSNLKLN
jgi:hypothetical protein